MVCLTRSHETRNISPQINAAASCFNFKSGQPDTIRTFWLRIRRLACHPLAVNARSVVTAVSQKIASSVAVPVANANVTTKTMFCFSDQRLFRDRKSAIETCLCLGDFPPKVRQIVGPQCAIEGLMDVIVRIVTRHQFPPRGQPIGALHVSDEIRLQVSGVQSGRRRFAGGINGRLFPVPMIRPTNVR